MSFNIFTNYLLTMRCLLYTSKNVLVYIEYVGYKDEKH